MNFTRASLQASELEKLPQASEAPELPSAALDALDEMRQAQAEWASLPIRQRLRILRQARHRMAREAQQLAASVPRDLPGYLHRTLADTIVAEVLPLLDACRFLEREAVRTLAPRRLSNQGRPFWLGRLTTVVHRVPVGVVLILAPGNYPMFLPGVQALQALAAGNAVLWKPARGGAEAAQAIRKFLVDAGLDSRLFKVLDETMEAGIEAVGLPVDKVFLTGSVNTGRSVMRALAETLTPSVMELSGCDAVFLLDGIDAAGIERAVDAIVFGLRLNGSATCMAPRRLFATAAVTERLLPGLVEKLAALPPVSAPSSTARLLDELVEDAIEGGATVVLDGRCRDGLKPGRFGADKPLSPTILDHAHPQMIATRSDIFAPLLSILRVADDQQALALHEQCPYALTVSIFGPSDRADTFAGRINAGNVLINDVIVSTADPRAPFGGRGQSGFGSTRGREGLLEMTAVKTVQVQGSFSRRPYQPTTPAHAEFFVGLIGASHGRSLGDRWRGLKQIFSAARKIK